MLDRSAPSFFHGKATSERPFCADCEAPMILSLLEPDKPGFDLRTYACLVEFNPEQLKPEFRAPT